MKVIQIKSDRNTPRYASLKVSKFDANPQPGFDTSNPVLPEKNFSKPAKKAKSHDPVRNPARSFNWLECGKKTLIKRAMHTRPTVAYRDTFALYNFHRCYSSYYPVHYNVLQGKAAPQDCSNHSASHSNRSSDYQLTKRWRRANITYILLVLAFGFFSLVIFAKISAKAIFRKFNASPSVVVGIFFILTDIGELYILADIVILIINRDERKVLFKLIKRIYSYFNMHKNTVQQ